MDLQNSMYLGPDSSNLYALPIFEVSTGFKSDEMYFSILFSISLEIFSPLSLNILIPLSKKSLCEALITTPNLFLKVLVR